MGTRARMGVADSREGAVLLRLSLAEGGEVCRMRLEARGRELGHKVMEVAAWTNHAIGGAAGALAACGGRLELAVRGEARCRWCREFRSRLRRKLENDYGPGAYSEEGGGC